MNNNILAKLNKDFTIKVDKVIKNCEKYGIIMSPICGLRDTLTQATIWKQSRTQQEIEEKIKFLKDSRAYFLAECIERSPYRSGPHVTNALPGYSWHQWGEAVDCVWINKSPQTNCMDGYEIYAEEAVNIGLCAGMKWEKFQDPPHIQLRKTLISKEYNIQQIDRVMYEKYCYASRDRN